MRVVLIIPTFNERGNIGKLIDELQAVIKTLSHEMQILVVDDDSPRRCCVRARTLAHW